MNIAVLVIALIVGMDSGASIDQDLLGVGGSSIKIGNGGGITISPGCKIIIDNDVLAPGIYK